ncbi:MAG: hypothetical protein GXP62_17775, partial [Oligoflexia bacterium]|nr:hypothetical protein [Oligoflexia bacterium]
KASAFFPDDVLTGLLDPAGPFPERVGDDLPMPDIPKEWFEEARIIANHYRKCW